MNEVMSLQPGRSEPAEEFHPFTWWSPYNRLWTTHNIRIAQKVGLKLVLIALDSVIIFFSCIAYRANKTGLASIFSRAKTSLPVVVLDVGLHRKANQVKVVAQWLAHDEANFRILGFEANPESADAATKALKRYPQTRVLNMALIGPSYEGDSIELFCSTRAEGVGDNIFGHRPATKDTGKVFTVAARRLSSVIAAENIDLDRTCVLLRMNIEGAEFEVLKDLDDAGILGKIDGFFGAWDDVGKLRPALDVEFRKFMADRGIRTTPFNDRDLGVKWPFRLRKRAIRYAIRTALGYAQRRKGGAAASTGAR